MASIIQVRRDTASAWTSANPTLASGELGLETDTDKLKLGDGSTAWTSLSYYTLGTVGYSSLSAAQTFTAGQRGEITALTDATSITTDLALSNNFSVTLAGNRTLANPTNIVAGQAGSIFITQDGTGSQTLAYGTYFKFVGGTAPTLSTAAASVDRIDYVVASATKIHAVASLDVK